MKNLNFQGEFMSIQKTHVDKTSAETKSIGFDYQYYFFLWKVLSLKDGESVGLEVKDDVHTELKDSHQILYQLKHTVKTKQNNDPVNLSSLDKDLWKTLSNWVQVITDKADNRATLKNQLEFINKTSFVLATNKSSSKSNDLINTISDFQNYSILIEGFNENIGKLLIKAKDHLTIKLAEEIISEYVELTSKALENYANYKPVLEYKTKSLRLRKPKTSFIENVGSSSNHMFLHLFFSLAMQEIAFQNGSPYVAPYLIIDQPSRPYYGEDSISERINLDHSDESKISEAFQLLNTFVKTRNENDSEFQMIIFEHVPKRIFDNMDNIHVVEEFKEGNALIPDSLLH